MDIIVSGLTVSARAGTVLDGVDLRMDAGEITALLGGSGTGKTTLAHALLGHIPRGLTVTAGDISCGGTNPLKLSGRNRRAFLRRAAYVDQDPGAALPPTMSVRDIISQRRASGAGSARPGDDRIRELLSDMGLGDTAEILDRTPGQLSGGQRRRVGVAAGIVSGPELLIVDEPTAGVDKASVAAVIDTIRRAIVRTGATSLIITHDTEVAAALADRTVHLERGIIRVGPASPAITSTRDLPHLMDQTATATDSPTTIHGGLRATGLSVGWAGGPVTVPVDFTAPHGCLTVISGPSGSGKSTLLRTLLGLLPPRTGSLDLDGTPLAPVLRRRPRSVRRCFAWIPQEAELALNPSVPVARALRVTGAPRAEIDAVLAMLDLGDVDVARVKPGDLSGGMRQRVCVAAALLARPDVLVADEPTSALDGASAELVLTALRRCSERGACVVAASHDPELLGLADRVVCVAPATVSHGPSPANPGSPAPSWPSGHP
ncbi:ABC transporter ATP-binding protein [Corynebacterium sp. TAE3-ERU16]|uniref:ABC transporter ATP-binding protein n=1 Tax=Corynebacterium sp. TAE3-ERU16 TaxID=2849493 RepID=UPI001C495012|nr:ATP-binding cassette domain-containing protein [Corynebacterium sp. TAE3-ERU16]MBV7292073.1 ATP-binding cassette domain-containing protein [Corynebacterium sp. TAE3-ERU16]